MFPNGSGMLHKKYGQLLAPIRSTALQPACTCGNHAAGGECVECRKKREGTLQCAAMNAIQQTPDLPQRARNAKAWQLELELFGDLGLQPSDRVTLPYPNIGP